MKPRIILNDKQLALTIDRLCHQLIENHQNFSDTVLIGIQPRGVYLADRIHKRLTEITGNKNILYGKLDVTFYRDDFRRTDKPIAANATEIDFLIANKNVVLVDDVLYTGRMVRASLDALIDFGRPNVVELLVLIVRRFRREFPIQADYVGKAIDSISTERVKVEWKEVEKADKVWITEKE